VAAAPRRSNLAEAVDIVLYVISDRRFSMPYTECSSVAPGHDRTLRGMADM